MSRIVLLILPATLVLGTLTSGFATDPTWRRNACHDTMRLPNGLFSQYYAGPGECGGVGAQLYVAPRPTPPLVGHTYITYEPLMPHEFLYKHRSVYWRRHIGSGLTRTRVIWR